VGVHRRSRPGGHGRDQRDAAYDETEDYISQVKLWTSRFAEQFATPAPSVSANS
jgi:hypothetical protein